MVRAVQFDNPAEEFDWPGLLRERLDQLGLSQRETARRASISYSHMQYLLNGRRAGSPEVHAAVAKALGVEDPGLLFPRTEAELTRARAFRDWEVAS